MISDEDELEEDFPSSSDEDEVDEDPSKHERLISKISSLGKKRKLEQREEPSSIVSEYHLSNTKEYHVNTEELLSALSNKKGVANLKTRLNKVDSKATHLLKPLPAFKKDKIQRKVAFEESSAKVTKWEPIVKHNRKAEHLKFPLQADIVPQPSLVTKVESFEPQTPMELEVAAVLKDSQNDLAGDQELTEAEKKALMKISLEEAKERRAELRKMRSLVSAFEQRQRRVNRIKSKKFHKVQRKLKEKRELKAGNGDDPSEDRLKKAERLRAKERATLKHSRMSKWAKEQLARNHKDPTVRSALKEQSVLSHELKQKEQLNEGSSDSEDSVISESEDDEEDHTHLISDPSNPWLAHNNSKAQSTQEASKKAKDVKNRKDAASGTVSNSVIDPQKFLKSTGFDGSKLTEASENLLAVQEAFAGDDVVEEFLRDKEQDIEDGKPKKIDTTLPGWGRWAGLGVEDKRKKNKHKEKEESEDSEGEGQRMDSNLKFVIINHKRDKKAAKHQVSKLPYPLTDAVQFKKTMAAPLGRHWNTETRHTELIRPKIVTDVGSLIQPMRMTDDVKQFMSKSAAKEKKRKRSNTLAKNHRS